MKAKPSSEHSKHETFFTRRDLSERWRCSGETIKRRQKAGVLHPVYLSQRKLLYKLSEVEAIEAGGQG